MSERKIVVVQVTDETHDWLTRRAGMLTASTGKRITTSDIVREAVEALRAKTEPASAFEATFVKEQVA